MSRADEIAQGLRHEDDPLTRLDHEFDDHLRRLAELIGRAETAIRLSALSPEAIAVHRQWQEAVGCLLTIARRDNEDDGFGPFGQTA